MKCSRRAFTLTELLVVVGIIGIVMSILAPTFVAVTDLARETMCRNNLSLLSKAAFGYMGANWNVLPANDDPNKPAVTYSNPDPNGLLPGTDSTPKWWCNKVYAYGSRVPSIYICPSDPARVNDSDPVQCGYGFNNTLNYAVPGGLGYTTLFQLADPERMAIIGHCGVGGTKPGISEGMVNVSAPVPATGWPVGHMKRLDFMGWHDKGNYVDLGVVGRCGFVMGSGAVKVRKYSEVLSLKNAAGKLIIFRGP